MSEYNISLIGQRLKRAREQREIDLDAIAELTGIPKRYISAIEKGQRDILPEDIYVRGYIRRYANIMGIEIISDDKKISKHTSNSKLTGNMESPLFSGKFVIGLSAAAISIMITIYISSGGEGKKQYITMVKPASEHFAEIL